MLGKRSDPQERKLLRNLCIAKTFNFDIFTSVIPVFTKTRHCLRLGLFLLVVTAATSSPAESLLWRQDKNSVDADIWAWDVVPLLEHIADATGWQIYLEPGTRKKISTKFKGRTPDKALDLLLSDLGRVLLPGTNGGPPRLLVFRSSEKEATQLVRAARRKGAKPIPNELIVTMKPGASIDDLAKKLGAKILNRSKGLNSGRLQFEDEEAANTARDALARNDNVASTDPNFPVASQPVLDPSGTPTLPNLKLAPLKEGEGIIIGLIDSAVQKQGGALDAFLMPGIAVAGETTLPTDHPTHGTSMWETLFQGVDRASDDDKGSRVRVLPVDVYGDNATTTTYEVAEGIYQAMKKGASIINLSLGSEGDTPYLYEVIRQGSESGRVFVASAGNEPVTTPTYPAAYPEVIAVTASDARGNIAPYANRGDFVDVIAPGSSLVDFNGRGWRVSGTSPAAAYISGTIAGKADTGNLSVPKAAEWLRTLPQLPRVR
jgi:hypothetical protein